MHGRELADAPRQDTTQVAQSHKLAELSGNIPSVTSEVSPLERSWLNAATLPFMSMTLEVPPLDRSWLNAATLPSMSVTLEVSPLERSWLRQGSQRRELTDALRQATDSDRDTRMQSRELADAHRRCYQLVTAVPRQTATVAR